MIEEPAPDHRDPAPGLSRRRILQNVAWSTPAIMVAAASPAYAVSGEPGRLTISDYGGSALHQGTRRVFAAARVACGSQDSVITGVLLGLGFNETTVPSQTPVLMPESSSSWVFASETVSSGIRYFTYAWTGAALSGSNTLTGALSIRVTAAGHGQFSTTFLIQASGTSLGTDVHSPQQSVTVSS